LLARDAPRATVEVLSNLHQLAGPGQPFAQRRDLVFVGGFRHPPNVDAVRWFVAEVFPRVRERLPDVRFHCIGSHLVPEVEALAAQPGVLVHGHVPDIAPYMDGCRIALAPLRYGAGVKGKVNLSMAHGQPVVATPSAVEGMHLRDGEDVLVAGDAMAFADAVVRLYHDEALWQRLSAGGLANVERHFSLDAARDSVRRLLLPARR
jgi:glycosyltransferase involved in cell wall biosynthesis